MRIPVPPKNGGISPVDTACYVERRAFLKALTTMTAALAVGGCGGGGPTVPGSTSSSPAANRPPVWQTVPTVQFTQGVASSVSIAAYASDPDGDALTITRNAVALPAGVTYDAAGKRFVYDGVGAVGSTSGVVLTADDGRP
jgi:hypothetical protein